MPAADNNEVQHMQCVLMSIAASGADARCHLSTTRLATLLGHIKNSSLVNTYASVPETIIAHPLNVLFE